MDTQNLAKLFQHIQSEICLGLEDCDGSARFQSDQWQRAAQGSQFRVDAGGDAGGDAGEEAGGGLTRVLRRGSVFEQAGVNFSEVRGSLPADLSETMIGLREEQPFYATGISLVVHPFSPLVPTTHANFRFLEVGDKQWFGGGLDLTPYYLFEEDAVHYHQSAKTVCDRHDLTFYPRFKKWCDEYFYLPHRRETRGIGGLFFDYLGRDAGDNADRYFPFVEEIAAKFLDCYLPLVRRRKDLEFTPAQKDFQLLRRGRYVEFNLIYDRGTLFGLKTGGRTESILMSLPPEVRWEYNYQVPAGSAEEQLLEVLMNPRDWV